MFDTGDLLPVAAVPEGSTLLLVGPPMAGKRQLALHLLAADAAEQDATVLISTDSSSAGIRAEYENAVSGVVPSVGVVDCAASTYGDGGSDAAIRRVSTPADLGAVGSETSGLLETLTGDRSDATTRIGLLSLTTLSLNNDADATVRFVHSLARVVDERDGLGVLTAHENTMNPGQVEHLRSFVDAVVSVRQGVDGIEVRIDGLDAPGGWHAVSLPSSIRSDIGRPQPSTPSIGTAEPSGGDSSVDFESLSELIERVDGDRPTLTICNRQSADDRLESITSFFSDLEVDVRETSLGTERPRDVALLHRGPSLIAASSVSELASGVAAARAEDDPFEQRRGPAILEALDERVFGARGVGRQTLIDASTAIEMTAWQTGDGTLHAGFQELSRYWESPRSRRVMHRIADTGVSVHVYGAPDVVPDPDHENVTVHPDAAQEIIETWFVAFDGNGRTDRMGALVVRESEPDVYNGFWTYEPTIASDVVSYVRKTYHPHDEGSQQAVS